VALFALVRRQLLLTTNVWTHECDVWVGLAAGLLRRPVKQVVGEGGARRLLADRRPDPRPASSQAALDPRAPPRH